MPVAGGAPPVSQEKWGEEAPHFSVGRGGVLLVCKVRKREGGGKGGREGGREGREGKDGVGGFREREKK